MFHSVKPLRHAFSLIELLVVIAIIGILMSLLFPAVQAVRNAANRTSCANNMRQIGLALINFHSAHRVFPASGWTQAGPGNPSGKFVGWRPLILPFVEQKNLKKLYDFNENWWEGTNPTAAAVPVTLFQCPSVPTRSPVTSAIAKPPRPAMTFSNPIGPTDYEAIMGLQPNQINPHLSQPYYDTTNRFSVMHRNSRTRYADIRDGTSQTIMVVECAGRPDVYRMGRFRGELSNDQGIGWADSEGPFSLDLSNSDGSVEGGGPAAGAFFPMNKRNDNEIYSFHAAGANCLFADGHVDFISETIGWEVMVQLVTRKGGEVVTNYQ